MNKKGAVKNKKLKDTRRAFLRFEGVQRYSEMAKKARNN